MEQELYKSRNVAKCVKAAYTLFNTNFRRIFKELWIPFLVFSVLIAWYLKMYFQSLYSPLEVLQQGYLPIVLHGVVSLLLLVADVWVMASIFNLLNVQGLKANIIKLVKLYLLYLLIGIIIILILSAIGAGVFYYFKPSESGQPVLDASIMLKIATVVGLVALVILLLLIPLYYTFVQYMMEENKLHKMFFPAMKTGYRHWGFLFVVYFVISLITLVFVSVMMMPALILFIAQASSISSIAMGDPSGLPSYFNWLYFITFAVMYFILLFFLTWALFVLYYAYGSIKRNEMDREMQKKESLSIDTIHNT
jgi:hypothetical protein